jgi:hypothetical protein
MLREIAQSVSITGAPWLNTGETRTLPTKTLTANILCARHNSAFSGVDDAAIRFFKFIKEISVNLSKKSLSRRREYYLVSGDDIEMWATKALLGMFHSQPKNTELSQYNIDHAVIDKIITARQLHTMCGMYLNAKLGVPKLHYENEITVGTITINTDMRLIGLVISFGGVSFDFILDPIGINSLRDIDAKLYRPAHLLFEGKTRAHVIFLSWSSAHSQHGVAFTRNLNPKAAARLRGKRLLRP